MRQLEYFVAVVEEGSFTRAAERVRISQSGVSAQVRQLERELGATLIDRGMRSATLTGAGEAAVKHAREVLAAADAMRQAVDDVTGVLSGHLSVGMVTACTVNGLFEALDVFHRDYPGVTITLAEDNSAQLAERVRAGGTDIALIGASGATPLGLPSLPIVTERLVAASPHFSERSPLRLSDLADSPLICMPEGTGIRTVFDQSCAARGVRPSIAFEASAPSVVADLAARGLGVAILSETIAAAHADRLRARIIEDADIPALLTLVWRPAPSPAAAAFLGCCRRAFRAQ